MMAILRSGVASLVLLGGISPAFADCAVNARDVRVICEARDADGFEDDRDGLTVTILPGALVGGDDAIRVEGAGNRVENAGRINAADEGIVAGAGLRVLNNGMIEAVDKGIDADDLDDVRIENSGEITAGNKAIRIGTGRATHVTNTGQIIGGHEGVEAGDGAEIRNSGIIASVRDDAVQIAENGRIVNTGVILSIGGDQDAIDIDSGTILNGAGGLIQSMTDAAIDFDASRITSRIRNEGGAIIGETVGVLVETDPDAGENTAVQIIDNAGVIRGGEYALVLGKGDDQYTHLAGGTLRGATDFGPGRDRFVFDTKLSGDFAEGAVMDGGAGEDRVVFRAHALGDVKKAAYRGKGRPLRLVFADGSVTLRNWELFEFTDATVSITALADAFP